ncbi:MAG: LPS-assembly protein LptD [Nitrospirae bacterium]|nr:LPS-assembly protein LptD [Nitrospirota bacterium]MBI3351439.1 LPS-assembly protein LptD [Nitrospirota bacterium]
MMTSFLFYSAPAQAQEPIKGLSKEPIQLQADHLEFFQETQTYVATGHIKMIQETKEMSGDVVNFNQGTGQMEISGHVIISEGANQIKADKVVLNVKSQTGIIYQGHMIFGPDHYHLDGEIIEKVDRNEYFARNAMVTTCECIQYQDPSPPLPWRITTSELKVSPDHYLTGKNVFFEIRNIPVFYSPFLYLPIIKERQSGLLIPKLDYNSQDGFKILQPFYWVIAKNQDATFSVDYRSLRGLGAEIEYRYVVNSSSSGSLFTHFFKDTLVGLERSEVRYGHSQTLSEHVNARISLNYVSDQDFFKDLSVSTIDRSQRSLESNVYVSGIWENQTAYLLTRFTRDLTTDSDLTLQKLPEVGYSFHTAPIFSFPLYLDFNSTATYFYRQTGLKAGRSDTYVRLIDEIPLPHFGILTPRAGLRKTIYTRSISEDHKFERNISDLGVGLDSSVSRVYGGSEALTHVIESSLLYEYVPPVDQSDLPQFDNLDFIPDKNLFTYSLTNRLLKKEEVFYLKLTDSYLVNPTEGRFSDLRSEMMIRSGEFKVKTDGYFNFYSGSTDIFNADILIDSPGLGFFSVGERFSRQGSIPKKGDIFNPLSLGLLQDQPFPIRFLTSTVRIFLPYRWTFAAQYYFDYQNNIVAEADYGIRYIANCWGFSVGYVRFPEKSQVTFLINLTGLAEQGSDNLKSLFGN